MIKNILFSLIIIFSSSNIVKAQEATQSDNFFSQDNAENFLESFYGIENYLNSQGKAMNQLSKKDEVIILNIVNENDLTIHEYIKLLKSLRTNEDFRKLVQNYDMYLEENNLIDDL